MQVLFSGILLPPSLETVQSWPDLNYRPSKSVPSTPIRLAYLVEMHRFVKNKRRRFLSRVYVIYKLAFERRSRERKVVYDGGGGVIGCCVIQGIAP